MRSFRTLLLMLLLSVTFYAQPSLSLTPKVAQAPPNATVDTIWTALSVFEGSYNTVTNDFDCQGMSIGVAQWNIGKSFQSVKQIIAANSPVAIAKLMPKHGAELIQAVNTGREVTLSFVRSLQNIQQQDSCVANVQKAHWKPEGEEFVAELGKLLMTDESLKAQRTLRYDIFMDGWRNATKWAVAYRGANASPSMREIAYFVDMQIFHGAGLEKFGIKYEQLSPVKVSQLSKEAIIYLETADDDFLLHKKAARRNAKLLQINSLNESEAALFVNAYVLSKRLNAPHAKQFKLTVINRRAAILFGQAYYSDKDQAPTTILLPQQ